MKNRILITGVGGFIASHLVNRLVKFEDTIVTGLDIHPGRLRDFKHPYYSFYQCDLSKAYATIQLIKEVDPHFIFHLASHPDGMDDFKQIEKSVQGTLLTTVNLLEGFRQCNDPKMFIYGDSCKSYGNCKVPYRGDMPLIPQSSYGICKSAGWHFCQMYYNLYQLPVVSVRPTIIYGPGQPFNLFEFVIESVLTEKDQIELLGGEQTRDPLYIDDAINLYATILGAAPGLAGKILNISGGVEYSVADIARAITKIMGSDFSIVERPSEIRPTDVQRSFGDNFEANSLLGWRPVIDLHTGIQKLLAKTNRKHFVAANTDSK